MSFNNSSVNNFNPRPSTAPNMQWTSWIKRQEPNQRQWSEKVIASPMERAPSAPAGDAGLRLNFGILVPADWHIAKGNMTKIFTFHSGRGGSNYARIYILEDEFYFLSAGHSYFAPITFGKEHNFQINMQLSEKKEWVEGTIDQTLLGSSNPLPGQFIPRHRMDLHEGDDVPYLQIGIDTHDDGLPEGVNYRELHWSLIQMIY